MTFEPIEHEPDDYEADDQAAGESLSLGERFKRYMAGRRDAGLGHRDPDTPETGKLWLAVAATADPQTAREDDRSKPPVDSWIDDAPITDRQLGVLRAELDNRRDAQFNKAVVRKLVRSVELARAANVQPQDEPHDRLAELERARDTWKSEAERRSAERNASVRRVGVLRAWLYELGHNPDAVDERLRRDVAALAAEDAKTKTAVHGLLADLGQRTRDAKAGD